MPSQRFDIGVLNKNKSKNTRMDFEKIGRIFDFRKDELMHIGRYSNAAQTMINLSKKLGRPVRVLDIGCGEMNTVKLFYKAIVTRKSDILKEYIGVDIDAIMMEYCRDKYGQVYKSCNAEFLQADLTTNPRLEFEAGYFDLIISFEFLEHIETIYSFPIIQEINRLVSPAGKVLISTPNSNGSNKDLPKDHIYEYSYEELTEMFKKAGFALEGAYGTCINISKIPAEEKKRLNGILKRVYGAFGENTAFSSVAIAPLYDPKYCKNVIYHLRKIHDARK